jgi:hypothetical protein
VPCSWEIIGTTDDAETRVFPRMSRSIQRALVARRFAALGGYLRCRGEAAKVNNTTSSPVVVLTSWCKLTTFTPVMS